MGIRFSVWREGAPFHPRRAARHVEGEIARASRGARTCASSPITCQPASLAQTSTSEFSNWRKSWAAARSSRASRAHVQALARRRRKARKDSQAQRPTTLLLYRPMELHLAWASPTSATCPVRSAIAIPARTDRLTLEQVKVGNGAATRPFGEPGHGRERNASRFPSRFFPTCARNL